MEPWMREEYRYRYLERLGMMCEDREPTPEQRAYAQKEAMATIEELKDEERNQL